MGTDGDRYGHKYSKSVTPTSKNTFQYGYFQITLTHIRSRWAWKAEFGSLTFVVFGYRRSKTKKLCLENAIKTINYMTAPYVPKGT